MDSARDLTRHPCFNAEVKGRFGRVHLPVAPHCNIKCNYCNRKYDCVNESRPGVTSAVLTPAQAAHYLDQVLEREPRITVAGIAGPGDPFADPEATLETMRRVRSAHPDLLLCLATNGLNLAPWVEEVARIGVSHVTVTVNAVDPEIGARIHAWVRDGKVIYRGIDAAFLLLQRQLAAIRALKERAVVVKVNTIVIPGINDHHVPEVARRLAGLGVDLLNCMPVYPNADTAFAAIPEPTKDQMTQLRGAAETYLPQMRHCTRCRADAVGLLGHDRGDEFRGCLAACSRRSVVPGEPRPLVAVATREGVLVNQHLGEVDSFQIWGPGAAGYQLIEERPAPPSGGGPERWRRLAETLQDCRAVLVSGIGETPRRVLSAAGVLPLEVTGFIDRAVKAVYTGEGLAALKVRRRAGCAKGAGCGGDGSGC